MENYELKYEDLLAIAHKSRMYLKKLRSQEQVLPPSEQRLEAICAEIEVTELMKRNIIVVQ